MVECISRSSNSVRSDSLAKNISNVEIQLPEAPAPNSKSFSPKMLADLCFMQKYEEIWL